MNDNRLDELLKSLPRQDASPRFTSEVLARVTEPDPDSSPMGWGLVTALGVFVLVTAGSGNYVIREREEAAALQQIRTEQKELTRQLASLRDETAIESDPEVHVAESGGVEYVLDLGRGTLQERQSDGITRESSNTY